jgi:hypothetical protein
VKTPKHQNASSKASPVVRPAKCAATRAGVFLARSLVVLLALAGSIPATTLLAQEEEASISREYRIKAAYLYQFGRYVEWPDKAFSGPDAPFVIGVLGESPVIADLEQIARIKKIQNRAVEIRRFASAADVRACNILFVPATLTAEAQAAVLRKVTGRNMLLVGDSADFLDGGGVVQFTTEENNIRIAIARKAADREGLKISAKLLQVARIVE